MNKLPERLPIEPVTSDRPRIQQWVRDNPLSAQHVDCVIAVMLKILDGKCKMKSEEKVVMRHLYHVVKHQPAERLSGDLHQVIAEAERRADEQFREQIYELRVLAETTISRPVMKGFKRQIREQGLFIA